MYQQIQIIMNFRGTYIEEYHEIICTSEIRDICNEILVRHEISAYSYTEAHFDCYKEEIKDYKKVKSKIASIDCPVPIDPMTESRFNLEVSKVICKIPIMLQDFVKKHSLDNSKSFTFQLESLIKFVDDFQQCLSEYRRNERI